MKTKLYSMFKAATLTALLLAGNKANATDITPGYYYMKATEVSSANGLYLRTTSSDLPRLVKHEMPETPTMDEKPYIWHVESMDGGSFSIQNIADGCYLGGQVGTHAHHGTMTSAPHAAKFTFFDTFNNGSAEVTNAWKLDVQTDRNTQYGNALRPGQGGEALFLWYCDSQGGDAPVWYFEPVDATIAQQLEQNPGTYNGADVEEGYYLVRANAGNTSKPGAYLYADQGDIYRTYQNTSVGEIDPAALTSETLPFIYYIKKTATGYTFQNQLNGRYIGGTPNTNGHHVGAVTRPAPMVLTFYEEKNAYRIEDKEQPRNDFLPALLNSGNEAFAWWAGSADWLLPNVYWDLVKLEDAAVNSIVQRTVYAVGSLQDAEWDTENLTYTLEAKGEGIYSGTINVVSDGDGIGYFTLYAATPSGDNIIQYSSPTKNEQLFPGIVNTFTIASGFNWAVTPGTYIVTIDVNKNTIRVNDPSDPDAVFSRAYAELKAAIEEAREQWPGLDLSSVEAVLNNTASTDNELKEAKNSIQGLIIAFVKDKMTREASEYNPMDVTVLLPNANCATTQGWTTKGAKIADNMMSAANSAFDISQTLTDLPNGVYEISVKAVSRYGAPKTYYQENSPLSIDKHDAYVYATACGIRQARPVSDIFDYEYDELGVEGEADYNGAGWFVPTNTTGAKAYFQRERYNENHVIVYVNDGTLTIGASRDEATPDNLFFADDWTLQYYGNSLSAMTMIATDMSENTPDVESTPAQATVKDTYLDAQDKMSSLSEAQQVVETYVALVNAYTALNKSQIAYAKYQNLLEEVKAILADNPGIEGPGATLLKTYLTEEEEPGAFANGTAPYILLNGNLDEEKLAEEMTQLNTMLENALKGGVSPGTEITALFRNMTFDEADFAGWTESHTGPGTCSGSHGDNSNLVAGWWNMDTAQLYQTGSDLPNGIYAITANAFYRPGTPTTCSTENEISAYMVVNGLKTPMMNILNDALSESEAQPGVNCHSTDYSTGDIRFPDAPVGASIAFAAGRYEQTVYGVVTDGKLTFGVSQEAYPAYDGDWMMIDNFKVVFMGNSEEAANAMVEAQCSRAEEMLASMLTYREETRNGLVDALDMAANDMESKYQKAVLINQLCNEAIVTGSLSAILEEVLSDFHAVTESSYKSGRMTEEEYNAYEQEFLDVWNKLFVGQYTDEEIVTMTEKYRTLALSLIPTVKPGYYYMKGSAASTYPDNYLTASSSDLPFLVSHEMPEAPTQAEKQFIWKVEALGDGTSSIQSIYDHRYLGGQLGRYGHHGTMDEKPHAITFTYSATEGEGTGEAWKLNANLDRDSGYGTALRPGMGGERLMLWYCDSQQGEVPAWVFEPVDESLAKAIEETVPEYTGDNVEEGYYYVQAAATNASKAGNYLWCDGNDIYRTYQKAVEEELSTTEVSEDLYPYIFHVTKQPGGYAFQNMKSQRYIGGAPSASGHHVGAVMNPAPMTLSYDEETKTYTILDESQLCNGFLPAYLNSGDESWAWWAGSTEDQMQSVHWNLILITDPALGITQLPEADTESKIADGLYTIDGRKVGTGTPRPGIYIKADKTGVKKVLIK